MSATPRYGHLQVGDEVVVETRDEGRLEGLGAYAGWRRDEGTGAVWHRFGRAPRPRREVADEAITATYSGPGTASRRGR